VRRAAFVRIVSSVFMRPTLCGDSHAAAADGEEPQVVSFE
jgi:hypothetical protein